MHKAQCTDAATDLRQMHKKEIKEVDFKLDALQSCKAIIL